MRIRRKWIRDLASVVFSVYYLIAAEQADEKVRKIRSALSIDHLRISWNKGTTPYLAFFQNLLRPKFARYGPKKIRIPRPRESSYKEPITAWLYYDGPFDTIVNHTSIVLDIPGGGFVAMDPRTNDDKLFAWCGKTGLPILSLDYKKAPEHPYPYALNECYDVYQTLIATRGRCIGLSGETKPRIVVTGDSAGGNLATGLVLMVLQAAGSDSHRQLSDKTLPVPDGLILMYPGLDMNINSWMTDEQMSLIQDQRSKAGNRKILRRKSEDYYRLDPSTPHPSDDEEMMFPRPSPMPAVEQATQSEPSTPYDGTTSGAGDQAMVSQHQADIAHSKPQIHRTRLAMSSMISYFNDRILTPEMMRAMIILYVGPHARPDFTADYLLSPLLAPEALLMEFPKTYFLTGERDPLVDDTVIFAGRLRQAKYNRFIQRKELGLLKSKDEFDEREHVEVALIPGISHGFLQFLGAFPDGWKHIFRCVRWIEEILKLDAPLGPRANGSGGRRRPGAQQQQSKHHMRTSTESSGDEDHPLEMTAINGSNSGGSGGGREWNGRARGKTTSRGDKRLVRQQSGISLGSEEDVLKRRMMGLTSSLLGGSNSDEGDRGSRTP